MKIGKIHRKSSVIKILLGLAAAGALLLASCQDIFDTAGQTSPDKGYGYVVVDLGDSARTTRPFVDAFVRYEYIFKGEDVTLGTNPGDPDKENTVSFINDAPNVTAFRLPVGNYKLTVNAYTATPAGATPGVITTPASISATGTYSKGTPVGVFQVVEGGEPIKLEVELKPVTTGNGTLSITITLPDTAYNTVDNLPLYTYKLEQLIAGVPTEITTFTLTKGTTAGGKFTLTYSDSSMPANTTYLLTFRVNTSNAKYGGFSEALHVYPYMTTAFTKDFTVDDGLAAINKPDEAYAILKSEIKDWITDTDALAKDGVDTSAAGTIRLNYVAYRTSLGAGDTFPIVLQGGWQISANSDYPATTWNVGSNDAVTKVRLENPSVKTNAQAAKDKGSNVTPADATYIVELWPIAEYTISFGKTVSEAQRGTRKVTVTDSAGTATVLDASKQTVSGVGLVGTTVIKIESAAVTMSINGLNNEYRKPQTGNDYTFTAGSNEHNILVYQTVDEQAEEAFARLKRGLTETDPDDTLNTPWVVQKNALVRVKADAVVYSASSATIPSYYAGADTVTLYYVKTRLNPTTVTTFDINVPNSSAAGATADTRWEASGAWSSTNGLTVIDTTNATTIADTSATANGGDQKTIYYRPYGGDAIPFKIIWKPAAEFYVNFVEAGPDDTTVYDGTSSVAIKDYASTPVTTNFTVNANTGPFNTYTGNNAYLGKKFILGKTNIAQTLVTITGDFTSEAKDGVDNVAPAVTKFDFFTTSGPKAYNAAELPANADIAQSSSTGVDITIQSREYHIRVYRTITKQISAAITEIQGQIGKAAATAWGAVDVPAVGATAAQRVIHPNGMELSTVTNETNTTRIVYAGTEPTIAIRADNDASGNPLATNFAVKGWSGFITPVAGDLSVLGSKTIRLKFTPKGAVEATIPTGTFSGTDGVYKIKLVPALLYRVNYQRYPIGSAIAQGNVLVEGSEFDGTGNFTPAKTENTGTPNPSAVEFIGLGQDIKVSAKTSSNLNVIKNRGDSNSTTNTSTAAGVLTIAKPDLATSIGLASVAANATPIEIDVYPSVADQQKNFLDNLRLVTRTSLRDWTGSPPTLNAANSVAFTAPGATDVETKFQVVANLSNAPSNGLQISMPSGYLFVKANATSPGYSELDIDNLNTVITPPATTAATAPVVNGNKTVKITFTPNGVTGTPPASDPKDYTFKLTAVAQYNVVLMNGPTGTKDYPVDLRIDTYKPGTTGTTAPPSSSPAGTPGPDEYPIDITLGSPSFTFYGGIGPFPTTGATGVVTNGPTKISSSSGNVFVYDSTPDTFPASGASGGPNTTAIEIDPPSSRVYTIRVYPTLSDQVAIVRAKLAGLNGTAASGWFSNAKTSTNTSGTSNLIGPNPTQTSAGPGNFLGGSSVGNNILEVMYWGDEPAVSTAAGSGLSSIITPGGVAADYGYGLAAGSATTEAMADPANPSAAPNVSFNTFGIKLIPLNFTPVGPVASAGSTSANPIFNIRTIPVIKYTVTYAANATGTITITPATGTRPNTPPLFNYSATAQTGYTGYSTAANATVVVSATKGSYSEVQFSKTGDTTGQVLRIPEATNGGATDSKAIATTSSADTKGTGEWNILVVKNVTP